MINFKIYLFLLPFVIFTGCLEEVANVPRETLEATLIVVRNEGNSDDEVNLFLDSFLVAKTFQDKISEVTIPAGQHTIFFEYDNDYYGQNIVIKPNSIIATRQYVLDAYMFKRVAFDSLTEDNLNLFLKDTMPILKYKYYEAKQKVSTSKYNNIVSDFEKCTLELKEMKPRQ